MNHKKNRRKYKRYSLYEIPRPMLFVGYGKNYVKQALPERITVMEKEANTQRELIQKLKQQGFSKRAIEHWLRPKNFGPMAQCNGYSGEHTGPCGDSMSFWIQVSEGVIRNASYETEVCIGSITSASVLSEWVIDKNISFAENITSADLLEHMGGLPSKYRHCAKLATDTLYLAIQNFRQNRNASWKPFYQSKANQRL